MDLREFEKIRRAVVLALFSDDELINVFVLKGGSLLNIAYPYENLRASIDVDLSMPGDFRQDEIPRIRERIAELLAKRLTALGYVLFDYNFQPKPKNPETRQLSFWGGYEIEFKIVRRDMYLRFEGDSEQLRRNALTFDARQTRRFVIDISKHEYCDGKTVYPLDGHTIFVYTTEMIVAEKLRAICQQLRGYNHISARAKRMRARDFYDIGVILENERAVDWHSPLFRATVTKVFAAKRVRLGLLKKIDDPEFEEFHSRNFDSVRATITPKAQVELKDFGFYFRTVVEFIRSLEPLGDEKSPSL